MNCVGGCPNVIVGGEKGKAIVGGRFLATDTIVGGRFLATDTIVGGCLLILVLVVLGTGSSSCFTVLNEEVGGRFLCLDFRTGTELDLDEVFFFFFDLGGPFIVLFLDFDNSLLLGSEGGHITDSGVIVGGLLSLGAIVGCLLSSASGAIVGGLFTSGVIVGDCLFTGGRLLISCGSSSGITVGGRVNCSWIKWDSGFVLSE